VVRQSPRAGSFEKEFGTVIRRHRQILRISQEELADRCDLHRTYISQIERGLKSVSLKVLTRLAKALKVRPYLLVREAEDPSDG
jgi:transcriptional regulator with XRE-family HTH domain